MELLDFLNTGYTSYHVVENVCKFLSEQGFKKLTIGGKWNVAVGGKYFVTRNNSSVIAFRVGKNKSFNICESHTDSPSFKIKGDKTVDGAVQRLNTETYGSGLLYTFFDRPLKVAGRVVVETENGVEQRLAVSNYNLVIPSLAIHHNPTANDSLSVNAQSDTLPLYSQTETELYRTLTDGKVLDGDLYVVPDTRAFYSGVNGEFLSSARLDNLTSVYSSIKAITEADVNGIAVAACLDNEEIGSGTRQGSPSFIEQVLGEISRSLNMTETEQIRARENGMVLSVDNGHAAHPAHQEKADVTNQTQLNGGVVIKHHVNYATDGISSAIIKKLLTNFGIQYQDYYNCSDVRCGSTLGLVTSRQLGMKTCDIGIAQLAMHSACETCGTRDVENMTKCLTAFLSANIEETDCKVEIK